jgi:hypothetical protein
MKRISLLQRAKAKVLLATKGTQSSLVPARCMAKPNDTVPSFGSTILFHGMWRQGKSARYCWCSCHLQCGNKLSCLHQIICAFSIYEVVIRLLLVISMSLGYFYKVCIASSFKSSLVLTSPPPPHTPPPPPAKFCNVAQATTSNYLSLI